MRYVRFMSVNELEKFKQGEVLRKQHRLVEKSQQRIRWVLLLRG